MNIHGRITCCWRNDLLVIEAAGPFNMEGATEAKAQLELSVSQCGYQSWRRIDITNDLTMGEPDVMTMFGRSFRWGFEHGCRAMAMVYSNDFQRGICEAYLSRHSINLKLFDKTTNALDWLETQ